MRIRAELLPTLWLSAISLSVLAGGCWNDDPEADDGRDAAIGGKGGKGGKGGAAGCEEAGTGGAGGRASCSRAGSGGIGGTPGAAGNGPWPSFGSPINGTCGVPPEPRWGFELYEDAKRIQIPRRGGNDLDATGMVTEIGDGAPGDLERTSDEDEANLRHVRVQASSHTYTIVTYGAPNFGDALSVGTEVSLSHHDDTCDYILCSPGNVVTILRSGDVETILYAPTGSASPEGYDVNFGEELCEGRTHCSAWTGHMLEVTSPSGVTLEFTPGTANELGDYTIHAGLLRRHKAKNNLESARFECADTRSNSTMEFLFFRTSAQ